MEQLRQNQTTIQELDGKNDRDLIQVLQNMLHLELKKDCKELDYLTVEEMIAHSDILKGIKNAVKSSIIDKTRRLHIERIKMAEMARKTPITVTEDEFARMFYEKYEIINETPFVVDENNIDVLRALSYYFMNDKRFESLAPNFSLSKGICLVGPYGCGKTSMMRAFQNNPKQHFVTVHMNTIFSQYKQANTTEKQSILAQYTDASKIPYHAHNYFKHKKSGICFDDPGKENDAKDFGENRNLFRDIILSRYDQKTAFRGLTHMTTNATRDQMIDRYGGDVVDRMNEMFNIIVFPQQKSRRV